jgi:hypothetical protein
MTKILFLALLGAIGCAPAGPAPEAPASEGRLALAPDVCRAAGWKTVTCVKSRASSRWYVGTPISATSYSEALVVFRTPSTGVQSCLSTGTRACGSHAYDVCNDNGVNYFYCGSGTSHLVEGYFRR